MQFHLIHNQVSHRYALFRKISTGNKGILYVSKKYSQRECSDARPYIFRQSPLRCAPMESSSLPVECASAQHFLEECPVRYCKMS